jgi:hypothetical protein
MGTQKDEQVRPTEDEGTPEAGKEAVDTTPDEQGAELDSLMEFMTGVPSPKREEPAPPPEEPEHVEPTPTEEPPVEAEPEPTPTAEEGAPAAETPPKEEGTPPETPPEEDTDEALRREINLLAAEMTKHGLMPGMEAPAPPPPEKEVEAIPPPSEEAPIKPEDFGSPLQFVDAESHRLAMENPEAFNKVLSDVYRTGREAGQRDFPEMVQAHIARQFLLHSAIADFYDTNPDLREYRDFVRARVQAIETEKEHAGKSPPEVLKLAGEDVRKRLRLTPAVKATTQETQTRQPAIPARARSANRRRPAPAPVGDASQESMVAELVDFIEEQGFHD